MISEQGGIYPVFSYATQDNQTTLMHTRSIYKYIYTIYLLIKTCVGLLSRLDNLLFSLV